MTSELKEQPQSKLRIRIPKDAVIALLAGNGVVFLKLVDLTTERRVPPELLVQGGYMLITSVAGLLLSFVALLFHAARAQRQRFAVYWHIGVWGSFICLGVSIMVVAWWIFDSIMVSNP